MDVNAGGDIVDIIEDHSGTDIDNGFDTSNSASAYRTAINITTSTTSVSTKTSTPKSTIKYNNEEYQKLLEESLTPKANVTTACHNAEFFSGINNQVRKFMGLVLVARDENVGQIIEESIMWKDTFGHNDHVDHHKLWDVVHWNSFFPKLPRLARYDKVLHPHLKLKVNNLRVNATTIYPVRTVHFNVGWPNWEERDDIQPKPFIKNPKQAHYFFRIL